MPGTDSTSSLDTRPNQRQDIGIQPYGSGMVKELLLTDGVQHDNYLMADANLFYKRDVHFDSSG